MVAMVLTILAGKDHDEVSRTASNSNFIIAHRGSNSPQAPGRVEKWPHYQSDRRESIVTMPFLTLGLPAAVLPARSYGCFHVQTECFSATESLDHPPELMLPCTNNSYVCTERNHKYFLLIIHSGANLSLKSGKFVDAMSFTLTSDAPNVLHNQLVGERQILAPPCVWEEHCTSLNLWRVF